MQFNIISFGFEILIINGLIVCLGLFIIRKNENRSSMIRKIKIIIILSSVVCYSQNNNNAFKYTSIVILDLSFFDHIYTGLDILEQMDFQVLKNKNIGIFCNHTALIEIISISLIF